jgi:hypothetical protein
MRANRRPLDSSLNLEVRSLSELAQEFPDILPDNSTRATTTDTAAGDPGRKGKGKRKAPPSNADSKARDFYDTGVPPPQGVQKRQGLSLGENPNAVPALHRLFSRYIAKAPLPRYILDTNLSNAEYTRMLAERRFCRLPISNATHESELLVQGGVPRYFEEARGVARIPPACCNGKTCEGLSGEIRGLDPGMAGFVLTAYQFPDEWKQFKETGLAPSDISKRRCVLCERIAFFDIVHSIMALHDSVTISHDVCFQMFRNPVTGPGAYRHDCMMPPPTDRWNGFCDLVVCHERHRLRWIRLGELWRIDQSELIAPPRNAPPTFPSGAIPPATRW